MGLIVAGASSAGGLTALAVKLSRKKSNSNEIPNLFAKATKPDPVQVARERRTAANKA